MSWIDSGFFERDPLTCARDLVGCVILWDGCGGRIVETEAYDATGDPACHTAGRPSARAFIAESPPGALYVYLNYGVHWLLNFLVKGENSSGFVLVRALEPVSGLEKMRARRGKCPDHLLCAGPGRLTKALGITGPSGHKLPLERIPGGGLIKGENPPLACGPRIGISKAMQRPWRFGEASSKSLSRPFGN